MLRGFLLENENEITVDANVPCVDAGGDSKLLSLGKEPKAEERKERRKSYSAPLATTRC